MFSAQTQRKGMNTMTSKLGSSHATFPLESKQNCKGKRKNLQEDFLGGISPPTEPKGGSDEPLRGRPPPPGLSGRGKPGSWRFWWIPSYHLQLQLFHHAFSQAKAKNKSKNIDIGGKRGDNRYILLPDVTEDHTMGWIYPVWTRTMGKHHDASQEEISTAERGQGPSRYARLSNGLLTLDSSELILTLRHKFHLIGEGRFELYVFYWQSPCYSQICTSSVNKEEEEDPKDTIYFVKCIYFCPIWGSYHQLTHHP